MRHKFQNFDGDFITILVIDTSLDLYHGSLSVLTYPSNIIRGLTLPMVNCRSVLHLVCFISNCVIEQPVDAFQSLMVVAYRLLIFRKKFLCWLLIFELQLNKLWQFIEIYKNLAQYYHPFLTKQPWLMKEWRNLKRKITCNLTHQY